MAGRDGMPPHPAARVDPPAGAAATALHEGEGAGTALDLDLVGFLAHLARLVGPVWPSFSEMFTFSAHGDLVPGDLRIHWLRLDAGGEAGREWQLWLRGGEGPLPEPSLLRRCDAGLVP
ncbi:hypothetical protein BCF33_1014 [Hasllibacter halocynthiae]|uniref:Uncharacterized protein n=2 Tax=Hasllibacter halocynthiae TaxID=595589 RepID=A0A2T0X906_9RHOB|nr:hypothetical protein BCF33_1014 [Hasllibacter halocynthiae]